jgi:hypothetical protein
MEQPCPDARSSGRGGQRKKIDKVSTKKMAGSHYDIAVDMIPLDVDVAITSTDMTILDRSRDFDPRDS